MDSRILKLFKLYRNVKLTSRTQCFSMTYKLKNSITKFNLRKNDKSKKIGPFGWFLLAVPVATFGLGTWQVQRKKWKEDLLAKLHDLTRAEPVKLPEDLRDIESMEYRPVYVRGQFLHDKELYMGPRTLILKGDASTKSELMSTSSKSSQGYLVITPFKLADRPETILINRGWIPSKCRSPTTREKGQVSGTVDVVGIVRLHENRQNFTPQNKEESNLWFYRDLDQMARITGASPVLLDATNDFEVAGGPIGGQTRVTLRNEHLSYIITWYSLCLATSLLWYKQFFKRI